MELILSVDSLDLRLQIFLLILLELFLEINILEKTWAYLEKWASLKMSDLFNVVTMNYPFW